MNNAHSKTRKNSRNNSEALFSQILIETFGEHLDWKSMTPQQQNDFLSALADTEVEITVKEHGKLEPSYGCIRSEACPFENRGPRFYLNNPNSLEARWLLRVCISEIKPISNEIFIIRYD